MRMPAVGGLGSWRDRQIPPTLLPPNILTTNNAEKDQFSILNSSGTRTDIGPAAVSLVNY